MTCECGESNARRERAARREPTEDKLDDYAVNDWMNLWRAAAVATLALGVLSGSAHAEGNLVAAITDTNGSNPWGSWNQSVGPWWGQVDTWDAPASSYSSSMQIFQDFPTGTVFSWSFPNELNGTTNVYAYPSATYGLFGAGIFGGNPANVPTPLQFSSLGTAFTYTFNCTLSGNVDQQDFLFDAFTSDTDGPTTTPTYEIGYMAMTPSYNWNYYTKVGPSNPNTFIQTPDGNYYWVIVFPQSPPYVVIVPVTALDSSGTPIQQVDGNTHTVQMGSIISQLVSWGLVDGSAWFVGVSAGPEIGLGSGTLTVNQLSYSWQAGDALASNQ